MGVASASSPQGPWVDSGQPLVYTPLMGYIDPHYFADDDGASYILWKASQCANRLSVQTVIVLLLSRSRSECNCLCRCYMAAATRRDWDKLAGHALDAD